MVIEQPIDTAQATSSTMNLMGLLRQSSRIQSSVGLNKVSIIEYLAGKYTTMKINEIVREDSAYFRPRIPKAHDFAIPMPDRKAIRALLTRDGPKILASGIARSVPGVANIFAAILTVLDVIKGDWVGAGLNATGLFFGPAVELPAFAYQLARDKYGDLMYPEDPDPRHFEQDMARDPKGTITAVQNLAKGIVEEMQAMAAEAREKVNQSGQAKRHDFATTGGGAAVGYPNR